MGWWSDERNLEKWGQGLRGDCHAGQDGTEHGKCCFRCTLLAAGSGLHKGLTNPGQGDRRSSSRLPDKVRRTASAQSTATPAPTAAVSAVPDHRLTEGWGARPA